MKLGFLLSVFGSVLGQEERVTATLSNGSPLTGKKVVTYDGRRIEAYLGIPYGKPPVNELRFSAPIPVDPWTQPREALLFGNSCWQGDDLTYDSFTGSSMWNANTDKDEDCLYLNVWTRTKNQRVPVMIWIYGGSFYSGTSSLEVYDGRIMADVGDVVIVSMNYRLGPFGFMPRLDDTVGDNAGLLDQRLAMKWVQDNIANFGGDPNQVTIFGESAGGASVGMHLVAPGSWKYFGRAIMQSGNSVTDWASVTYEEALRRTSELATNFNCPTGTATASDRIGILDCLRKVSASELNQKQWIDSMDEIFEFAFVPVKGTKKTDFLPGDPPELVRQGKHHDADIIFGWNKNEGNWFAVYLLEGYSKDHQSLIQQDTFVRNLNKCGLRLNEIGISTVAFEYGPWSRSQVGKPEAYRDAIDQIIGDKHIVCPGIEMLQNFANKKNVKTYAYVLNSIISSNVWPKWMGVMHGYEIEYVFGIPLMEDKKEQTNDQGKPLYSEQDKVLADRMVRYWTNFAKYGTPQGRSSDSSKTLPAWPEFDGQYQTYIELDTVENEGELRQQILPWHRQCAFWNEFIPELLTATAPITEAELQWKNDLARWDTAMNRWESAFDKYDRNSRRRH